MFFNSKSFLFFSKFFLILVVFLFYPQILFAFNISVSSSYPKQGDVLVVSVFNSKIKPLNVVFDSKSFHFYKFKDKYVSFIGLNVDYPKGWKDLEIDFEDGSKEKRWVKVLERKKIVQILKLSQFTGESPKEIAKKMAEENKVLNEIASLQSDVIFSKSFGLPLANNKKIVTDYGVLRQDGNQQTWHLGVDIDAPYRSVVATINDGIVEFASSTISYGNTIVINHGGGIFSLYLHLDKILVSKGEKVNKGKIIGYVGNTGYSTGPHLHLSIKVNGVSVDPISFVKTMENL